MKVQIKRSEAPNTIIKYQTLFYNGPETSQSLEWNSNSAAQIAEGKSEFKNNFSYISDQRTHLQNILSTTNIRVAGPRVSDHPIASNHLAIAAESDTRNINSAAKMSSLNPQFKSFQPKTQIPSLSPRMPMQGSPRMKTTSIDRSPPSVESRIPSFQNLSLHQVSSGLKSKFNWHVDQEALLNSKRFKDLLKTVKESPHFEGMSSNDVAASMVHLKGYYEIMLQRLFNENKNKFTSSSFFKTLFAEDFGKEIRKKNLLTVEEFSRKTPVDSYYCRLARLVQCITLAFPLKRKTPT